MFTIENDLDLYVKPTEALMSQLAKPDRLGRSWACRCGLPSSGIA